MTSWSRTRPVFVPRSPQARGINMILKGEGARMFLHPGT